MSSVSPNRQARGNENAESLPGIVQLPSHLLLEKDGKPIELQKLLLELGCNIFTEGKNTTNVMNENPLLMKLAAEAIRKYQSGYASGNLVDIRARQMHGTANMKPLSEIGNFVGNMGMMRRDEAGIRIREGGGFEIEECKKAIRRLYARIGTTLAEKVINERGHLLKPEKVEEGTQETRKKVFSLTKLPPAVTQHQRIVESFSNMGFAEMMNILMNKYHVESDKVITSPAWLQTPSRKSVRSIDI